MNPLKTAVAPKLKGHDRFDIRFPDPDGLDQDEEFCEVVLDGTTERIRFHDYNELYSVPGLYEQLFYEELKCDSPRIVCELLVDSLDETPHDPDDLRVLDIGAGNGMVAEELVEEHDVDTVIGVDIIKEAAEAAERDRPHVYEDYHVIDLTDIPEAAGEALQEADLNCMVTVAALGFGDIPPEAFANAYDYVEEGGLVAFSIKSEFIEAGAGSGFARLVNAAMKDGSLDTLNQERFVHRLSAAGEPIHYDAIVAEKSGELPDVR